MISKRKLGLPSSGGRDGDQAENWCEPGITIHIAGESSGMCALI